MKATFLVSFQGLVLCSRTMQKQLVTSLVGNLISMTLVGYWPLLTVMSFNQKLVTTLQKLTSSLLKQLHFQIMQLLSLVTDRRYPNGNEAGNTSRDDDSKSPTTKMSLSFP
jgi:hypothetical protein